MAARASYIAPLRHRMLVAREAKLGKVLAQLSPKAVGHRRLLRKASWQLRIDKYQSRLPCSGSSKS
jgi:hypothetical protein